MNVISLTCKLVPVHYWEYECSLLLELVTLDFERSLLCYNVDTSLIFNFKEWTL